MDWKNIFKPTLKKVFIFSLLFFIANFFLPGMDVGMEMVNSIGFPFPIYIIKMCAGPSLGSGIETVGNTYPCTEYFLLGLVGDVIIWYTAAILIVFIYKKYKKSKYP